MGCLVAAFSGISAGLIWTAPSAEGLNNIDPIALKNTTVAILLILGVATPLAAAFSPPRRWRPLKAAIFAVAGFSNAAALGPVIVVPLQGTTSIIAVVCALGLAVLTIVAFMDSVQKKNPQSKF
jgi:peptidoglycan/LPS O-acetylase OafA/YrhL